jgi:hypothetical protein
MFELSNIKDETLSAPTTACTILVLSVASSEAAVVVTTAVRTFEAF